MPGGVRPGLITTGTGGGTSTPAFVPFTKPGTLTAGSGVMAVPFPAAVTITGVIMRVGTAPTGAAIVVDVNKNGSTIFTTQGNRPSIAVSTLATAASAIPDIVSFAAGDYLTVDIDTIGSVVAGADLSVQVSYV